MILVYVILVYVILVYVILVYVNLVYVIVVNMRVCNDDVISVLQYHDDSALRLASRALPHQAESRSPAHGRHYCMCVWACRRCRACQLVCHRREKKDIRGTRSLFM